MGENTAIAWCDHTHNPWWGCDDPLSPACINCYARAWAKRCGFDCFGPSATTPRRELSDAYWAKPLKWNREAFDRFGRRARVFHGSMCDLFEDHPQLPPLREREWELIEATPNLKHLLLTKRIENVVRMVPERWIKEGFPKHVRIGCTIENQAMAERRIPELLKLDVPNFISMEPLLGWVSLDYDWLVPLNPDTFPLDGRIRLPGTGLNHVIVGGESGSGARIFDIGWARDIVSQCKAADVPVFMKQLGSNPRVVVPTPCDKWPNSETEYSLELKSNHGSDPSEWPEDLRVQEFPE